MSGSGYAFSELHDRVCVVTGGSGAIGSALVWALAGYGVKTAIVGRNARKAEDLAARVRGETGSATLGVRADVTDQTALHAAKETINRELGPIDLLVNCAGGNAPGATT
ncbi:MAG TPA: SDR family NAD(P)-dependent oxidoreductase, partial [Spirochaetia bacterium]|nr:SDR family NAD(P)-dependent oxidoreductase [Spirochaetia bacterium]